MLIHLILNNSNCILYSLFHQFQNYNLKLIIIHDIFRLVKLEIYLKCLLNSIIPISPISLFDISNSFKFVI